MKVYILSPHIDDAAFGLTLTIDKLISKNISVTIINCFTISSWTCVFVSKDVEVVTQLRKQEDAAFNQLFDSALKIIHLDMLDAPLRNGYIIQNKPFEQNEWELVEHLKNYLQANVDGLLFCPLGIGNHIDHAIAKEAVSQLYKNMPVLFYEDLPYAFRISNEQTERHTKDFGEKLNVKLQSHIDLLNNNLPLKEKAVGLYKSQVNEEICSEIKTYTENLGGERIWGEVADIDLLKSILIN